jgi:hypothetical protein
MGRCALTSRMSKELLASHKKAMKLRANALKTEEYH